MSQFLKGKEHLARMAGLFAVGITSFFVLRYVMVPAGFGLYGHYRPGALADNRIRAMSYAGRAVCEQCHPDVVEARKGGKHAAIGCEACHGPLARHAEAPGDVAAKRPDGRETCLHCHLASVARPKAFPQVQIPEHSDAGPCIACHKSHAPAIS
jgi:hypothetical protein